MSGAYKHQHYELNAKSDKGENAVIICAWTFTDTQTHLVYLHIDHSWFVFIDTSDNLSDFGYVNVYWLFEFWKGTFASSGTVATAVSLFCRLHFLCAEDYANVIF